MQQAVRYPTATTSQTETNSGEEELNNSNTSSVAKLVTENAVVVFARSGCCMCHVMKLLLHGHGVSPIIFDIHDQNEAAVISEFSKFIDKREGKVAGGDGGAQFPAVFVGGNLFGGLEEVMAAHISGELVPIFREAGALWL